MRWLPRRTTRAYRSPGSSTASWSAPPAGASARSPGGGLPRGCAAGGHDRCTRAMPGPLPTKTGPAPRRRRWVRAGRARAWLALPASRWYAAAPSVGARGRPNPHLAGGNVVCHHRAGAGHRPAADRDGRHQQRVAADGRVILDNGAALLAGLRAEVDGDRASADVDALANLRVADIAEVVHLRTSADAAGFDLRVIAKRDLVLDHRAWAEMAEWANADTFAHDGALQDRKPHARARSNRGVDQVGVRPDLAVAGDAGAAAQMAAGLN